MTTLAQAQETLAAYQAAELAVLAGKEVRLQVDDMLQMVRREDLPAIQAGRREWERRVAALSRPAGAASIGGLGVAFVNLSNPT